MKIFGGGVALIYGHAMNIAIEAFSLSPTAITGIGNVTLNYINQLRRLDRTNSYFVYTIDGLNHVTLDGRWRHVQYTGPTRRARLSIRDAWAAMTASASGGFRPAARATALALRVLKAVVVLADEICFIFWLALSLRRNRIEVYFGTYADFFPLLFLSRMRKIWLIHDLVWKLYPSTTRKRLSLTGMLVRRNMKRADLLLAVSERTRTDVSDILGVTKKSMTLHNAADASVFFPAERTEVRRVVRRYGLRTGYILSVCTLEPRKNIGTLLRAYGLMRNPARHNLVLTGMSGWKNTALFEMIRSHPAGGNIIVTGYVPVGDLAPLYSGARVFVYPSLYEGFGLPVLEAMRCGCPVITSNVSSLPEVAGDACVLVDPNDCEGLAEAMERVCAGASLRASMIKRGLARAELFSWERSARLLLELFYSG